MTYVPDTKEIVMFGGDDLAACLNDTWVYSCEKRRWQQVKTKTTPQHRAGGAMVYVPEAKQVLLIGGYTGHWRMLGDVWSWDPKTREWSQLGLNLPGGGTQQGWVSACYDPGRKSVIVSRVPNERRPYSCELLSLKFDAASAARKTPKPANRWAALHGNSGRIREGDKAAMKKLDIARLPANTWVDPKPKQSAPSRGWGQNIYDAATHQVIAWGGGHSTYPGVEYDFYEVLNGRFLCQNHPIAFNHKWWHQDSNCPPGLTPNGTNYVPGHSRRGYGVDPISGCVVTCGGDVLNAKTRRFVKKLRQSPFYNSGWGNPANVTTPHGLYMVGPMARNGRGSSGVAKVNVKDAKWEVITKDGGPGHHEYDHLVYDSKRDRMIHVGAKARRIDAFDFKTRQWSRVKETGGRPAVSYLGGSAYVPELDAVCTVIGSGKRGPDGMYFFKLGEGRWYTVPWKGVRMSRPNTHGLSRNVFYDPKLKLLLHTCNDRGIRVFLMRPDFKTLKLVPLGDAGKARSGPGKK
jgi:hypothetical protein